MNQIFLNHKLILKGWRDEALTSHLAWLGYMGPPPHSPCGLPDLSGKTQTEKELENVPKYLTMNSQWQMGESGRALLHFRAIRICIERPCMEYVLLEKSSPLAITKNEREGERGKNESLLYLREGVGGGGLGRSESRKKSTS